jgi:hypothetical protein
MKHSLRFPLILLIAIFFTFSHLYAGQCQAITKKGTQCKRQASAGSVYCWQHGGKTQSTSPKETKKSTIKKEDSAKTEYVSTQCQAITKKGTQCKRKAKAGSIYCWQHQK